MKTREKTFRLAVIVLTLATGTVLAQTALKSPPEPRKGAGIEFVPIKPGDFTMGCSNGDPACSDDEKPAHHVKITKAFEIGKYEVTQTQWQSVMGVNPSAMKGDTRPVESISKGEALEFLSKLNALNDGYRYRLPTEAEWEYAARAGSSSASAGKFADIAWYSENSDDETHPVGKKKPNAWGLYDMQGNVREWVSDFYGANYYGSSPETDPTGPAAGARGGFGGPGGPGGRGPRGERRGPPPEGRGFPPEGRGGREGRGGPPRGFPPDGPPPDFDGGPPPDGGPRGGPDGRGPGGRGGGPSQLPVMRGGGWDNRDSFVRVSARYNYYGDTLRVSDVGFRAVREKIAQ